MVTPFVAACKLEFHTLLDRNTDDDCDDGGDECDDCDLAARVVLATMIGGDDGAFLFGLGKVQAHVSDGSFKVGHRSGDGFKGSFVEYEAGRGSDLTHS